MTDNNITSKELEGFKVKVNKYLKIDDQIKHLTKELREKRKEKLMMSNEVLNFMDDYKIEDLNTNGGKLKYSISRTKKAVSKSELLNKLSLFLKSSEKANDAMKYIYDNREVVEKVRLKRLLPRKKKNLNLN